MPGINDRFLIEREHYALSFDKKSEKAEIKMYGQVVKKRPVDWWTGEKVEGDFIVSSEFVNDIENLDKCKELSIRLDSVGGDVHAAIVIHNRLREMSRNGTKINCTVDGVAMSAGSMIMCAADHISVSEESLIMIHKSSVAIWDRLNADELRKLAEENDKYDEIIVAAYKRKTGLDENELLALMADETYMTGDEAFEKGFADEVFESENKVEIAACADKQSLIINGRMFSLFGMPCPNNVPTAILPENGSGVANKPKEEVVKVMAKNLAELKAENPELAAEIEKEIFAANTAEKKNVNDEAVKAAVEKERARLAEIDEIAVLYSPEIVKSAKYGDEACSAAELAYREAVEDAKSGKTFLKNVQIDTKDSGVNNVAASAGEINIRASGANAEKAYAFNFIDAVLKDGKEEK